MLGSDPFKFGLTKKARKIAGINAIIFIAGALIAVSTSFLDQSQFSIENQVLLIFLEILGAGGLIFWYVMRTYRENLSSILDDFLYSSGQSLDETYRLNIMHLRMSKKPPFENFFEIIYGFRMNIFSTYNKKFNLSTPGIGTAYTKNMLVYLPPSEINKSLDAYPKHIWCMPIRNQNNTVIAILNIDTSKTDVTTDEIENIKRVIRALETKLATYLS